MEGDGQLKFEPQDLGAGAAGSGVPWQLHGAEGAPAWAQESLGDGTSDDGSDGSAAAHFFEHSDESLLSPSLGAADAVLWASGDEDSGASDEGFAGADSRGAGEAPAAAAAHHVSAPPVRPPSIKLDDDDDEAEAARPRTKRAREPEALAAAAAHTAAPTVGGHTSAAVRSYDGALPTEQAFALLTDAAQPCSGRRPDFLTPEDDHKLFVERTSGTPPLHRPRRTKGMDKWAQNSELQLRQVKGVSYGEDGRGEIWVRTIHGTIVRVQEGGGRASRSKDSYHLYELHFFDSGYQRGQKANFARGSLYHVRMAGGGAEPLAGGSSAGGSASSAGPPTVKSEASLPVTAGAQHHGRLDLRLRDPDKRWLQLLDADGADRGALVNGEHGPLLTAQSGDFAEYHLRAPDEAEFEEGEIVGFGADGLTRKTMGTLQIGIISRRMIIAGSRPDVSQLSRFDTVAYSGKVPVKLRGGFSQGDFVVPSGRDDGTGVAARMFAPACVGRTLEQPQLQQRRVAHCCCHGRMQKNEAPTLVMVGVLSPSASVSSNCGLCIWCSTRSSSQLLTRLLLALVALILLAHWLCAQHCASGICVALLRSHCKCRPIVLQHGKLRGDCAGTASSTCTYMHDSCDDGFALVPKSVLRFDEPPSIESRSTIGSFPACNDTIGVHADAEGWICYRDSGWCVQHSNSKPEYCALSLPACRVCTHPAIDSGWRACESDARDGSHPRCLGALHRTDPQTLAYCGGVVCTLHHSGRRRQENSDELTVRPLEEPSFTRTCRPASGGEAYTGGEMHCVARHCPSETVGLLRLGLCASCHGKEAVVQFPRTTTGPAAQVVTVGCPAGFDGSVNRTCGTDGWGPTQGSCRRRHCPRHRVLLDGLPSIAVGAKTFSHNEDCLNAYPFKTFANKALSDKCEAVLRHTLTFDPAAEGTGRVVVQCPAPGYAAGEMTATCAANSSEWTAVTGHCVELLCPAASQEVAMLQGRGITAVRLPQQQRVQSFDQIVSRLVPTASSSSQWLPVPCCNKFSTTGSAIDNAGAFGSVLSRCDEFGARQILNISDMFDSNAGVAIQCQPRSVVATRFDQPPDAAGMMYRAFSEQVQADVVSATGGAWQLPPTGILSSVSVSIDLQDEQGQRITPPSFWPVTSGGTKSVTIDSRTLDQRNGPVRLGLASGRSAAAFADVACRSKGYRQAVMVTNCAALFAMQLDAIPVDDAAWWHNASHFAEGVFERLKEDGNTHPLFTALCPELLLGDKVTKTCPGWLEVRKDTDSATRYQLEWLKLVARFQSSPGYVYDKLDVTGGSGISPPDVMTQDSSCSGEEDDIARCFQSQVLQLMGQLNPRPTDRPCLHKLLIGCSNDPDRAQEAVGSRGTWVIGDEKQQPGARMPPVKIFQDLGGPFNCSSGLKIPLESLASHHHLDENQLCWGKLLPTTAWPIEDGTTKGGVGDAAPRA
jgi:hypothetical protein